MNNLLNTPTLIANKSATSLFKHTEQGLKSIALIALLTITPAVSASIISEDFTSNVFDNNNFELGSGNGIVTSEAYTGVNRGTLRTVADNLYGTLADPLTVTVDLTFTGGSDIAFLAIRSSGVAADANNEPSDSVFLRLHNFANGQVNIAEGANYGYFGSNVGNAFFNSTVRITLTDDGSSINLNLLNLLTSQTFDFATTTNYSSGLGHVAFSSNTAAWDNIQISHSSLAAVPEPSMIALMGLGLLGLSLQRRKIKR